MVGANRLPTGVLEDTTPQKVKDQLQKKANPGVSDVDASLEAAKVVATSNGWVIGGKKLRLFISLGVLF